MTDLLMDFIETRETKWHYLFGTEMSSVFSSIYEVVSILKNILMFFLFICCIVIETNKATVSK